MKPLGTVWSITLICLLTLRMADAANVLKPVVLPTAENSIVGAAFSPDSSRVAIMRNVVARGASTPRHSIQIVELKSGQTVAEGDVLKAEAADLAAHAHLITYSPSGRYLLLATEGSDVLSIVDATNLQSLNRIALHPEADSRGSLGQAHPYFRGVIGLASSSKGDLF